MKEINTARICVPVCARRASELPQAIARAAKIGDIIELRLDYLESDQLDVAVRDLPASRLRTCSRPLIFTFRPIEQGGQCALDLESRCAFWRSLDCLSEKDFVDWELDLSLQLMKHESRPPQEWARVICSHHDFARVPADLEQIYERLASTPARVLKIAVQADDITDCIPVFHLLERARREGREMICIAMGEAGIATRILGPSRGAFLTYGSLDQSHATAPGQITATDLHELYRVHHLDQQTEITGLIGYPVAHSISPHMHNAAFAAHGINAVYIPFAVRDAGAFLRRMAHPRVREINWPLRGLSVTAPHKGAVIEHLDWIESAAQEIGAVNTIVIEDDAMHGYNTDAAAFLAPLQDVINSLSNTRIAFIGAGGAARSALWGLRRAGASVTLFVRNLERGRLVAKKFDTRCERLEDARFDNFDVVINTTPLGTRGQGENETPATASQLRGARLAYDLVYNPHDTRFLREAREAGCETINGLPMLIAQAAEQFKLWTGVDAHLGVMRNAAGRALEGLNVA